MRKRHLSNVITSLAAATAAAPFASALFTTGGTITVTATTAVLVLALLSAADAAAS